MENGEKYTKIPFLAPFFCGLSFFLFLMLHFSQEKREKHHDGEKKEEHI
jgi:hypothetical protein